MNTFITSVFVLCIALVVAAVLKMFSFDGRTQKVLKLVISLFIILIFTSAIKSIAVTVKVIDSNDISKDSEKILTEVQEEVILKAGENIAQYLNQVFTDEGISAEDIKIILKNLKGVIYIDSVSIYISSNDKDKIKTIESIVLECLSLKAEIIIGEQQ